MWNICLNYRLHLGNAVEQSFAQNAEQKNVKSQTRQYNTQE